MQEFVGDIAGAVTSGDVSEDFVVECIGTLSNILNPNDNIDIHAVVVRYKLIPCIMNIFEPGMYLKVIDTTKKEKAFRNVPQ